MRNVGYDRDLAHTEESTRKQTIEKAWVPTNESMSKDGGMMESVEFKVIRLEERMVTLAGEHRGLRGDIKDGFRTLHDKLDTLSLSNHGLSAKVFGLAGTTSVLTAIVTVLIVKMVTH